jgi:hypothetical protein
MFYPVNRSAPCTSREKDQGRRFPLVLVTIPKRKLSLACSLRVEFNSIASDIGIFCELDERRSLPAHGSSTDAGSVGKLSSCLRRDPSEGGSGY